MKHVTPGSLEIHRLLDQLRRSRFAHGFRCPRCNATRITRWGRFSGRQRYRCRECGRTFSDLTLTPAFYVKKLRPFVEYCACLADGLTVRKAAARVGVHPSTAFRWRHSLLDDLIFKESDRLAGWIEFEWVLVPYSRKGQRRLYQARKRGVRHGRRTQVLRVSVWAACDRRGGAVSGICPSRRPGVNALQSHLDASAQDPIILTDLNGPLGPAAAYARLRNGHFHDARRFTRNAEQILQGVESVTSYLSRLRLWMHRFRGVATRYLDNYLRWHLIWDRSFRQGLQPTLLQWYDKVDPARPQASSGPTDTDRPAKPPPK